MSEPQSQPESKPDVQPEVLLTTAQMAQITAGAAQATIITAAAIEAELKVEPQQSQPEVEQQSELERNHFEHTHEPEQQQQQPQQPEDLQQPECHQQADTEETLEPEQPQERQQSAESQQRRHSSPPQLESPPQVEPQPQEQVESQPQTEVHPQELPQQEPQEQEQLQQRQQSRSPSPSSAQQQQQLVSLQQQPCEQFEPIQQQLQMQPQQQEQQSYEQECQQPRQQQQQQQQHQQQQQQEHNQEQQCKQWPQLLGAQVRVRTTFGIDYEGELFCHDMKLTNSFVLRQQGVDGQVSFKWLSTDAVAEVLAVSPPRGRPEPIPAVDFRAAEARDAVVEWQSNHELSHSSSSRQQQQDMHGHLRSTEDIIICSASTSEHSAVRISPPYRYENCRSFDQDCNARENGSPGNYLLEEIRLALGLDEPSASSMVAAGSPLEPSSGPYTTPMESYELPLLSIPTTTPMVPVGLPLESIRQIGDYSDDDWNDNR